MNGYLPLLFPTPSWRAEGQLGIIKGVYKEVYGSKGYVWQQITEVLANINTADPSIFSILFYTSVLVGKSFVNQVIQQQCGVRVLGCQNGEDSVL